MKKLLLIFTLSLISNVMAAEEVKYTIIVKNKLYEIRKYSDRLVIETKTSNQNSGLENYLNISLETIKIKKK